MATIVGQFVPSVKGGYETDAALHRRNWKSIQEYLRGPFVTNEQLGDGAVQAPALAPGAVTDAAVSDISADKITGGNLMAQVDVSGLLQSGSSGQRWLAGQDGIFLEDAGGQTLFSAPVTGDAFMKGFFSALGITIEGNLSLAGIDNVVESGTVITMGGGSGSTTVVSNPASAPGVQQVWEQTTLAGGLTGFVGLSYDSAATASFWTMRGSGANARIYEFNASSGANIRDSFVENVVTPLGVCRAGTRVFVLYQDHDGDYVLKALTESALGFLGQTNVENTAGITIHGRPGIGTDGTNVFVVDLDADTGGKLRFHKFSLADKPAFVSTTVSSGASNPTFTASNTHLTGFVNADSGWWVSVRTFSGAAGTTYKWNTSGVYQANNEFPGAQGTSPMGVAHDGSVYWTLTFTNKITKHTGFTWTTESPKYWVAYTWVDDNGAASAGSRPLGGGDFETKKSPSASITLHRRGRLRITVPTKPATVTHAGIYIDRGSAEPTLDYQTDITTTSTERTSFATGAAPPATNTFSGTGTAAEFRTGSGEPLLRATGFPRLRVKKSTSQANVSSEVTLDWASSTTIVDTDSMADSANDRFRIPSTYGGQWLLLWSTRWSGAADVVHMHVERSANGTVWTSMADEGLVSNGAMFSGANSTLFCGAIVELPASEFVRCRVSSTGTHDVNDWSLSFLFVGPE